MIEDRYINSMPMCGPLEQCNYYKIIIAFCYGPLDINPDDSTKGKSIILKISQLVA